MVQFKGVRQIRPYKAGKQPTGEKIIKLNTNENAYGPSPQVEHALRIFDAGTLRSYSTLDQDRLRAALAEQLRLSPEQLIVGNGSDDVLSLAFLAFFNTGKPVLFPDLTYGFYRVWADLYSIPYRELSLDPEFRVRVGDYLADNGGIVLANPNAPTGLAQPLTELERILAANREVIVIVDEAYVHFGGETALSLLDSCDNLIITRTFSKDAALAGLRVGYAAGHPDLIAVMKAIKNSVNPYSVDGLAEELALAAVKDWTYYEKTGRAIQETRDWFSNELRALDFQVLPSAANFVLAKPEELGAGALFAYLEEQGIYVRYFPENPRLRDWLRISIGRPEEMEQLLAAVRAFRQRNMP